jgi:hypothetical protein
MSAAQASAQCCSAICCWSGRTNRRCVCRAARLSRRGRLARRGRTARRFPPGAAACSARHVRPSNSRLDPTGVTDTGDHPVQPSLYATDADPAGWPSFAAVLQLTMADTPTWPRSCAHRRTPILPVQRASSISGTPPTRHSPVDPGSGPSPPVQGLLRRPPRGRPSVRACDQSERLRWAAHQSPPVRSVSIEPFHRRSSLDLRVLAATRSLSGSTRTGP